MRIWKLILKAEGLLVFAEAPNGRRFRVVCRCCRVQMEGGVSGTSEALAGPPPPPQPMGHTGRPGGGWAVPLPPDAVSSPLLPHGAAFIAALGRSSEGPSDPPGTAFVAAHPSNGLCRHHFSWLFFNPRDSFVLVSVLAVRAGNFTSSVSSAEGKKRVMFNVSLAPFFTIKW